MVTPHAPIQDVNGKRKCEYKEVVVFKVVAFQVVVLGRSFLGCRLLGRRFLGRRFLETPLFSIMASFPIIQLTEGEWTSEKWYDILGVKLPFYFTSDPAFLRDYIDNFQTRPDDVFIVGYPKSGTSTR